jgi:hypothetical protein
LPVVVYGVSGQAGFRVIIHSFLPSLGAMYFRGSVGVLPLLLKGAWLLLAADSGDGPSPVEFADATETSGLRFLHRNSATANKYLIETMAGGAAVFDYDNDGWLDVFFVNGARLKTPQPDVEEPNKSAPEFWNRLYRNNRNGTFTDVTATDPPTICETMAATEITGLLSSCAAIKVTGKASEPWYG